MRYRSFAVFFLCLFALLTFAPHGRTQTVNFVMLYHSAWGDSRMIDSTFFNRNAGLVTHIIHFKIDPLRTSPYFTFDGGVENHSKNRQQIIADAHARGMKVLLCIGGVSSGAHEWSFITRDSTLTQTVVDAMSDYARTYGYDGLDLDWESELTLNGFQLLSRILRRSLDTWSPRGILTAAVGRRWDPLQDVATLNSLYDYVNIMTYDCNSYWSGTTGFHEPLYNPLPNYPAYDPASAALNIHAQSSTWVINGLDKTKSSLGFAFYGWAWEGGLTAPGLPFTWVPNLAGYYNYFDATNQLAQGYGTRHYDSLAHQPWISNPGGAGGRPSYVNYQDEHSLNAKLDYLRNIGWGGVMLFANEHAADLAKPLNERWPLLNAVRSNLYPPIPAAPIFLAHPQDRSVQTGSSATFSVALSGYPAPAISWQKNGIDIPGATGSVFTIPNATLADNGTTFRCVATNSVGTVTSNPAILTVAPSNLRAPSISGHPTAVNVLVGETATFSISVDGNPTPSLQWQKNGANIDGATSGSYTTPSLTLDDNAAQFRCVASNSQGTTTSNSAVLTVSTPAAANPISDDFSNLSRSGSLWRMSNPALTSLVDQGTRNAALRFTLDSTPHDLWINIFDAPRVLQDITNGDFEVVAKFQSLPTTPYQMQGIVVKEHANSWLRFDVLRDHVGLKIYSGYVSNTVGEAKINLVIDFSRDTIWLKTTRQGNLWRVSYSSDGIIFIQAGQFSHTIVADSLGVFAGNAGSPAPPFMSNVDYFFNTSNPIDPEDPSALPSASFVSSRDSLPFGGGNATLSWTTTDAQSATIEPGIGAVPLNGSRSVYVDETRTYTLKIANGSGTRDYSLQIHVAPPGIGGNRDDITSMGNPWALVTNPTGTGSRSLSTMHDGISPALGSTSAADQYDTFNGISTRTFDWVGYSFSTSLTFSTVEFQEGLHTVAGGYFSGRPKVEVRVGEVWKEVSGLTIAPTYRGGSAPHYQTYRLTFDSTAGDGIRVSGAPGGSDKYISVAELRVIGTTTPTPRPEELPKLFDLTQNYPNPFNPMTTFRLLVASSSHVKMTVANVLGQTVRTLVDQTLNQGTYPIVWDGRDNSGATLPSGVYMCTLQTQDYIVTRKVILTK